jgi:ketosteroid isomerase-like protein
MVGSRTTAVISSLAAGVLVTFAATSCGAPQRISSEVRTASYYGSEEARIRHSLTAYAAARQRGDGAAQAALYSDDAEFWNPMSEDGLVRGHAKLTSFLAGDPEPFRLEPVNISFASAEVALVDAHFFGSGPNPNGVAYYVMARRNGRWLIRAVRIMPLRKRKTS